MRINALKLQQNNVIPCFKCHGMSAENRVTIDIGETGELTLCLCGVCSRMTETELYAHFAKTKWTKTKAQEVRSEMDLY